MERPRALPEPINPSVDSWLSRLHRSGHRRHAGSLPCSLLVFTSSPSPFVFCSAKWTTSTNFGRVYLNLGRVDGMQTLVSENVLDQFNLYRMLAGLPNVTLNGTKSDDAQAAAWWDAALSTSFTPM